MCRAAAADGITHMVASPHANDRYHYDREYLQGLLAHLQQLVGGAPKLTLGCDFHLSYDNLQDAFANMASALRVVEGGDRTVPSQAVAVYNESEERVKAGIKEWNEFKNTKLPLLNKKLSEANLAPISISKVE